MILWISADVLWLWFKFEQAAIQFKVLDREMMVLFFLSSLSLSFPCCLAVLSFSPEDLSPAASCNPLVGSALEISFL